MNHMYVRGIQLPVLNDTQQKLLSLFEEEETQDFMRQVRIDEVTVMDDVTLEIVASQFIDLERQASSSQLVRHLQIQTIYTTYDASEGEGEGFDPYCDFDNRRYREVRISSMHRTLEGDQGWIVGSYGEGEFVYKPDTSDLCIWEV